MLEQSLEDLRKKIIFLNLLHKAKCVKLILWIHLLFWSDSVLQKGKDSSCPAIIIWGSRTVQPQDQITAREEEKIFFSIKHSKFTDEDENFHPLSPKVIDLLANMSLIRFWKESTWTTVCYIVSDCNDCKSLSTDSHSRWERQMTALWKVLEMRIGNGWRTLVLSFLSINFG